MNESESISVSIQIDREQRVAVDVTVELEQAGLFELNVLHNLNIVIGRVALTGAVETVLDNLKQVPGVKDLTADPSTLEDWII